MENEKAEELLVRMRESGKLGRIASFNRDGNVHGVEDEIDSILYECSNEIKGAEVTTAEFDSVLKRKYWDTLPYHKQNMGRKYHVDGSEEARRYFNKVQERIRRAKGV